MSDTPPLPDYWPAVETLLNLFFPQFYDTESPQYVPPEIMQQFAVLSEGARPWCIPVEQQNFAQANFIAYLVSLRGETSSGQGTVPVAGPVISEREGDVAVTYANLTASSSMDTMSKRPPSDPWDIWNRFWMRCARGTITTRFGDPCKSGGMFTLEVIPIALNVWRRFW